MWPELDLFDDEEMTDDSESVEFVSMTCKCAQCLKAAAEGAPSECHAMASVPGATKGAQKRETVKTDAKGARIVKKKPSANIVIKLPVKVCKRSGEGKKDAETYIMQTKPRKYIAGQTVKASSSHVENVQKLFEKISNGDITDSWQAKDFLADLD
eukprot:11875551-Karenia_brevis.AAC.1